MRQLFFISSFLFLLFSPFGASAKSYDSPDTIVVSRDGTGEFRTINEAIEVCRAFMEYHKVIFVKNGVYKEKLVIPSWLTNIEICGENRDSTIITNDDHANILSPSIIPGQNVKIGTFRTYTLKIEGSRIMLRNITIENNAPRLGQAVALHTEGDNILCLNCRFLGDQDTVYTGVGGTRLLFRDCYIEGTTDFIFGPSTAWFENCHIHGKINSYLTAASTPKDQQYGYIFNNCRITLAPEATKVYLGRPWRDYAYTLFMNCTFPSTGLAPEHWNDWNKPHASIRYYEYGNHVASSMSAGSTTSLAPFSHSLSRKQASALSIATVLGPWFAGK